MDVAVPPGAAPGSAVTVTAPDGRRAVVRVPADLQEEQRLRVRFPPKGSGTTAGGDAAAGLAECSATPWRYRTLEDSIIEASLWAAALLAPAARVVDQRAF